mmetsp:Transcript_15119/g.45270  ORF Transcript_15119/g.45270 Transcript_15119/m.45270 type:complete len:347 (-) Transcript_15119:62-1102(-)
MCADTVALQNRVHELENQLQVQENQQTRELRRLEEEVLELRRLSQELEEQNRSLDVVGRTCSGDQFLRRVEWTVSGFSAKEAELAKGQSVWSPKFRVAGIDGLQLEFFPKGREKTTYEGFCSLFLWCPSGTRIKYQLWVGSFLRSPDEDEYAGRIGHGHSNFCPIAPEVDRASDSVKVGVDILEVLRDETMSSRGVQLVSTSLEAMVAREAVVLQHGSVGRAVWKIKKISERLQHFPQGSSMWSPAFTAGGIREVLLEFYPNGSTNTTKDGFCAFYIRCPEGTSMIVTLFVGKVRKGPIKTTFDRLMGKGLPDFCTLQDEIDQADDSLELGIELQNQPNKTLSLES